MASSPIIAPPKIVLFWFLELIMAKKLWSDFAELIFIL
jgi:hypothetical protein